MFAASASSADPLGLVVIDELFGNSFMGFLVVGLRNFSGSVLGFIFLFLVFRGVLRGRFGFGGCFGFLGPCFPLFLLLGLLFLSIIGGR